MHDNVYLREKIHPRIKEFKLSGILKKVFFFYKEANEHEHAKHKAQKSTNKKKKHQKDIEIFLMQKFSESFPPVSKNLISNF
jgi:hypothetical protein